MHPPDRPSEKGAGQGAPNFAIQTIPTNIETNTTPLDLQAAKLVGLYCFAECTARTIAAHAYRVRP
jgi:hypothetical protein